MGDFCDRALDYKTKEVIGMVGVKGDYEPPKSKHMLSHLTSERACNDHQKETTRKLIRQQEELLRNLSKVRQQMELEEAEIGKTRDYYSGSRENKFGHTLDKADKLRRQREKKRVREYEENGYIPQPPNADATYSTTQDYEDDRSKRFGSDIQRLKSHVSSVASRYRESDGTATPHCYLYDQQFYPGQSYFQDETPSASGYYYVGTEGDTVDKLPTVVQADGSLYKLVKIE